MIFRIGRLGKLGVSATFQGGVPVVTFYLRLNKEHIWLSQSNHNQENIEVESNTDWEVE